MISIREIDYELQEEPTSVLSRLTWKVERVNNLWSQLITYTVSTQRTWVGIIDKSELSFGLVRPSSMWKPRLFQIIVKGKIHPSNGNSTVSIKIRLGLTTSLMFLALYAFAINMIIDLIRNYSTDALNGVLLWILIFPIGGTLFLNYKMNQVEKDLDILFDK